MVPEDPEYVRFIDSWKERSHCRPDSYFISGRKPLQGQEIEYSVHTLRLQADERHNLQLDPFYVPTPVLNEQLFQSFHVPSETVVKFVSNRDKFYNRSPAPV